MFEEELQIGAIPQPGVSTLRVAEKQNRQQSVAYSPEIYEAYPQQIQQLQS